MTSDNQASELRILKQSQVTQTRPHIENRQRSQILWRLRAVDIDHLEVQRGIITAFIGPNGAGRQHYSI